MDQNAGKMNVATRARERREKEGRDERTLISGRERGSARGRKSVCAWKESCLPVKEAEHHTKHWPNALSSEVQASACAKSADAKTLTESRRHGSESFSDACVCLSADVLRRVVSLAFQESVSQAKATFSISHITSSLHGFVEGKRDDAHM